MQRIDLLIGASLLLAVLGSAVGILVYEDDRVGSFAVTWTTSDSQLEVPSFAIAPGAPSEAVVEISTRNLTRAVWTVTVSGAPARPAAVPVLVELVLPSNETLSAEGALPAGPGASVDVPVEVVLAPIPNATSVTGPSIAAARFALDTALSSTLGVGNWTLRVSVAPALPGPLGGAETYSAAAAATLTSYEGAVSVETPEVARS